ncbi:MAG: mannose-1-phosphate guanylyltransferase/mannose-6-phosphate isomerase [Pseudomonadota bacterium]
MNTIAVTPVILSGGSGSRLWPSSRASYPKQLRAMVTNNTMLQDTALRASTLNDVTSPIVVCNDSHRFKVAEQLQALGLKADIILEPEGKNTAPAVALAAAHALQSKGENALLLIMPADHVIADESAFADSVHAGIDAALAGDLVTFGIVPDRPHTGYGYIKAAASGSDAVAVEAFVEKPDLETATQYVGSGQYFWNSGMFLFRADAFIEELKRWQPAIADAACSSIDQSVVDLDFIRPEAESFSQSPSDSIDYAVMEKTDNAKVVPMNAGWSDVGSWPSLQEARGVDENGNALGGDVLQADCKNSLLLAESRLVAAVGLRDHVVVETKDAVLVAPKAQAEDVKKLVDQLREEKRPEALEHRQVFRPWGSYDSVDAAETHQVKRLIVKPGAILSLQRHRHRAEHWVVVKGTARITRDDEVFDLKTNESTYIPIGAIHRIANVTEEPVHIVEVQCGDYLGEDDIERFEDNYGREGTNT